MTSRYGCSNARHVGGFCAECFEKQLKIDRLEEEMRSLKAKLGYRTKKASEAFFGSSTPSSKIFTKPTLALDPHADLTSLIPQPP